jgi:hypothetical protein
LKNRQPRSLLPEILNKRRQAVMAAMPEVVIAMATVLP